MNKTIEKKFTKRNLPKDVRVCIKVSQEKKGEGIIILYLAEISSFTDYFIIMQTNSIRQSHAIYESIEKEMKKASLFPLSVEGKKDSEWILMDYGSFVVHILSERARDYYSLEKLWADAPRLTY